MNAKKAKALRNLIARMVEKGVNEGDYARYGTVAGNPTTRVLRVSTVVSRDLVRSRS